MRNLKTIGFLLFLCLLGLGMGRPGAGPAEAGETEAVRKTAPDFTLSDVNGRTLQLSALRGKVVLVDFWATWCGPCRSEIPSFGQLYSAYKSKGFEIIGIDVDENPGTVRSFMGQNGVPYPVAVGNARVYQAYGGIRGIPTTFLIDKKGRIAQTYVGAYGKDVFEKEILKLLAE